MVAAPEVALVRPVGGAAAPAGSPAAPRSAPLSRHVIEDWAANGVEVRRIVTLHELRAEGLRMRSCVTDYREKIQRGEAVVFHAQVGSRGLTIAISPCMGGWRVSEWKGFANRPVTETEVALLGPWMRAREILHHPRA
ncbi:PcfJ domain-containing protein [Anaeromyxobacter dehalogenans]|uniref:Uncharacterized protein n=1 Tax=Anaeromyxobacter dehalogenans (strain 2CP-C) TaxID=290397 RepID=Q2IFL5_ANADE|nr:PcfJ domain-containing protein [Anaeromyxobacter dehalogenans]ABC83374.1 hypothetical protein Adeh_3608 [Anaeromyxobacter dehalogenans 2CP-C]